MRQATTKKKTAPVQQPEAPKTAKQQVSDALEAYFSLENAVHATYLLDGEIEITAAQEQLLKAFEEIELEVPEEKETSLADVVKFFEENRTASDDRCSLDTEEVHSVLDAINDPSDIGEWLKEQNGCWSMIKTESLLQRNKLEEFLRAEIWPADNLYRENVIL